MPEGNSALPACFRQPQHNVSQRSGLDWPHVILFLSAMICQWCWSGPSGFGIFARQGAGRAEITPFGRW